MSLKRTGHSIKWPLKSATAVLILASASFVGAQTLQTLYSFNMSYSNGGYPSTALTLGNDGNFYGTTSAFYNNTNKLFYATVFKISTNGTLTTVSSFNDGSSPTGLTLGNDGCFYGTTSGGSSDYGTLFKVTTNGTLTTLVSFNFTNGTGPNGLT